MWFWIRNWLRRRGLGSQEAPVQGRFYTRTGGCNGCGKCCHDIYLVHEDQTIQDEATFRTLQTTDREFSQFEPMGEDEHGLRFKCIHLLEDNRCGIYDRRPLLCRQYPSEHGMLLGSQLPEECDYQFHILKPFAEVLAQNLTPVTLTSMTKTAVAHPASPTESTPRSALMPEHSAILTGPLGQANQNI